MATEEAKGTWHDDLLGRAEDAKFLYTFLRKRSEELTAAGENRSFVLNIDARWGDGKTFFLTRFREELAAKGHVAVYVNAWEDDFADDPLLPVMAAVDREIKLRTRSGSKLANAWQRVKEKGAKASLVVSKAIAKEAVGLALTGITGTGEAFAALGSSAVEAGKAAVSAADVFLEKRAVTAVEDFVQAKASIKTFSDGLSIFVRKFEDEHHRPAPLFILIDELDRCRPTFAIALLERIKHLFSTPGIVFIMATYGRQLVHSIGVVYGERFEGDLYLARFFDRRYSFAEADLETYVKFLLARAPFAGEKLVFPFSGVTQASFMTQIYRRTALDLRSIAQVHDVLRSIVSSWDKPLPLQGIVLLPMIVAANKKPSSIDDDSIDATMESFELGGWTLEGFTATGRDRNRSSFSVEKFVASFWESAKTPIHDYRSIENRPRNTQDNWISEAFEIEANQRYSRGLPLSARLSVAGYANLVRQAGRLAKLAP